MTERAATASVSALMNHHRQPSEDEDRTPLLGEMAGMDQGMRVLSYLIAGVLVYGGLGWLGDHALGTSFLLPIGIVLGAASGCYVIIRRYGQLPGAVLSQGSGTLADHSTTDEKSEGAR